MEQQPHSPERLHEDIRIPLQPGQQITIRPILGKEMQEKEILLPITIHAKLSGEGASSVCYEAFIPNSGNGILKEFYPRYIPLTRCADGQLNVPIEDEALNVQFAAGKEKYLHGYQTVSEIKMKLDTAKKLASFIPDYQILEGYSESQRQPGTAYIWFPKPELTTFEAVCEDIRNHPDERPQYKLALVLKTIIELTDCIRVLHHEANLLHRDIKPANFGFLTRDHALLEQTLSIFDLDSVCSVYDDAPMAGTPGYMDPFAREADVKTDIYSIGATLFQAVIIGNNVGESSVYRPEFFPNLEKMVNESLLIQASEDNCHPHLRFQLTKILKTCLCAYDERYKDCSLLKKNLETALSYLMPTKPDSHGMWVWKDVEKQMDQHPEKDSRLMMQYHLYRYPLYQFSQENDIRVLLIGFGNYGQKFLDSCLQAGQIDGKTLRVSIITRNEEDQNIYLSARPMLPKFFNVNGSIDNDSQSYGQVDFTLGQLPEIGTPFDDAWLSKILERNWKNPDNAPHYLFIALGDNNLNLQIAKHCARIFPHCCVSFAWDAERSALHCKDNMHPVYVAEDVRKEKGFDELERIAFNIHLVWKDSLAIDMNDEKHVFSQPYYYHASMDNAFALTSKLYSIGITLPTGSETATTSEAFTSAAHQFVRLIEEGKRDHQWQTLYEVLIWLEHRRWVTEKICDGWMPMSVTECIRDYDGATQDKNKKVHICICRSKPNLNLRYAYFNGTQKENAVQEKWDAPFLGEEKICLDEFDRMSLDLHRAYLAQAEKNKEKNILSVQKMENIEMRVKDCKPVLYAWLELAACMKDIWNRVYGREAQFTGLKNTFFMEMEKGLPEEVRSAVRHEWNDLEKEMNIYRYSARYQDWKYIDMKLIDQIPFILTYDLSSCIAIPFSLGNGTALFQNAAAATIINPARLLYLFYAESPNELRQLTEALSILCGYMQRKQLRAEIEVAAACLSSCFPKSVETWEKRLRDNTRIQTVRLYSVESGEAAAVALREALEQMKGKERLFALEENKSPCSLLLQGAGASGAYPHYRYRIDSMRFDDMKGCDAFSFITKKPFIVTADMMAFKQSHGAHEQPEFFDDYQKLWEEARSVGWGYPWKALCKLLKKYAEEHDRIAVFSEKRQGYASQPAVYHYRIPIHAHAGAKKILRFLKAQNIVGKSSAINPLNSDTIDVEICDPIGNQEAFNALFSDPLKLMPEKELTVYSTGRETYVLYDHLVVSDLELTFPKEETYNQVIELLNYLKGRYLTCFSIDEKQNRASFSFASEAVKKLLTNEGKLLEIYVYHKLKSNPHFHDVVNSFEVDWEDTGIRNEFDCVVTRFFSSVFIECKDQRDLNQDYYFKLASLVSQFGMNAKAVLIADTKTGQRGGERNEQQRQRGNMMHVITITDTDKIKKIDETILSIMNGAQCP